MTNYFKTWTEILEQLNKLQFDDEGRLKVKVGGA